MTGRLTKLRRRRDAAAPDPSGTAAAGPAAEQPTIVMPAAHAPLFADAAPAPAPTGPPLPADVAPGTEAGPSFRDRGAYRRRLRYLRRVRELGFRDLGGLVFDQHRFERRNDDLVRAKVDALQGVDRELRALEHVLGDERAFTELREPGVSVCPRCGALPGSDAHFCPACGTPQHGARTIAGVGPAGPSPQALAPTAQPVAEAPAEPAPASEVQPEPELGEAATAQHEAARPSP